MLRPPKRQTREEVAVRSLCPLLCFGFGIKERPEAHFVVSDGVDGPDCSFALGGYLLQRVSDGDVLDEAMPTAVDDHCGHSDRGGCPGRVREASESLAGPPPEETFLVEQDHSSASLSPQRLWTLPVSSHTTRVRGWLGLPRADRGSG